MAEGHGKLVSQNKKARHNYFIEETFEAGIVLTGTEVKSVRQGKVNLSDSYAEMSGGELFIVNMHISPYEKGNIHNVDPMRRRKLLMHKREINKLGGFDSNNGYTIVPLKVYINARGLVKVQIATALGKKLYDKRNTLAKRDSDRQIQRALRDRQKY